MLRYSASLSNSSGWTESRNRLAPHPGGFAREADTVHVVSPAAFLPPRILTVEKSSALVRKLSAFGPLGVEEHQALELLSRNAKPMRSEQILVHEGSATNSIHLIVGGLACRYKMLAAGRRQILGYLIPGDLCDLHFAIVNKPDHSVALLGDSMVARIPIASLIDLMQQYPKISRALTLASLIDSVILREWLLSVGQRDAMQKLCHFFCEMAVRLEAIGGINDDGTFELPVNQVTLADTLGLTAVHINRTLQRLRTEGLIRLCNRRLAILDRERLATIAGFDGAYLTLGLAAD